MFQKLLRSAVTLGLLSAALSPVWAEAPAWWGETTALAPIRLVSEPQSERNFLASASYTDEAKAPEPASKASEVQDLSCDCQEGCDACCPSCQECCGSALTFFGGYDAWHGPADGSGIANQGTSFGFNWGRKLGGALGERGIGIQAGASYGTYDWSGRPFNIGNGSQSQEFITYGFFKRANGCNPWSWGIVQDWMLNDNFGLLAQNPTLSQYRGTLSYALCDCNEIGVWASLRDRGDSKQFNFGNAQYRPVSQANFFWHHKTACCADLTLWTGLLQNDRLGGNGSIGDWTLGGNLVKPFSDCCAVYSMVQYGHPTAQGGAAAVDKIWNVSIGLVFYPRCNARTCSVLGNCNAPLQNVANNGSFVVDSQASFDDDD